MSPSKHIVISGWYGLGNVGDEALLRVFCQQMRKRANVRVTVLSERPKGVLTNHPDLNLKVVHHYPLFGLEGLERLIRGRHRALFKALRRADLFVLGGGSLLRDNTTWKNFLRVVDEFWLARWFKKPAALYALGVGPFRTGFGKKLAGRSVASAGAITVRDAASRQHLLDTGIAADRVQVVTDPAFLLPVAEVSASDLGPDLCELIASGEPLAFVYPTQLPDISESGLTRDQAFAEIAAGLDRLAEARGLSIVFIPFQNSRHYSDLRVAQKIIAGMVHKDRTYMLGKTLPPEEAKYLATLPAVNICIRLHAFIFAASLARPAVAINYEPKVRNNARLFGIEDAVADLAPGLGDAIFGKAVAAMDQGSAIIAADRMEALRHDAERTFDILAALLNTTATR